MTLEGLGQLVGKNVHHNQGLGFGIRKLVCHFLGRIERIDVYDDAARLQDRKGRHRKGQTVGHLDRNAVTLFETRRFAQIDGEAI